MSPDDRPQSFILRIYCEYQKPGVIKIRKETGKVMDVREANIIKRKFNQIDKPTEEDIFLYTEAMDYLIRETKDPHAMFDLGGYFYGNKRFDLALKYYEMAAEYKLPYAYEGLGYIWYYGRTGKRDFEKAFHYYSLAKEAGILEAAVKVADMYKNGYYVEADYEKYKQIIRELYPKVSRARYLNEPRPEVYTRYARIRKEEGKEKHAIWLLRKAKEFQAQRLKYNAFFGDINIMMWLIDDLYEMKKFDLSNFDLFDCFWLLRNPVTIGFRYEDMNLKISAGEHDGIIAIRWENEIYPSREDFFAKAMLGDTRLMSIYDELYGFEVL